MERGIRNVSEWIAEKLTQIAGVAAIIFVLLIFVFLLNDALPLFEQATVREVLTGTRWSPTFDPSKFGMVPLMMGSLYVTVVAMLLGVPLGVACAVFIAEVAPNWMQEILKPAVELLAAIPSVVYGFLGLLMLGPWMADLLDLPVGQFAALGGLILAFMAMPTIVSISEDALRAVPLALRQSSWALGATRWQTISRVCMPAARSGIVAAIMLGLGRAIGETMTVLMVTGNAAVMPEGLKGLWRPIRTMTATIAAEMGETAHDTPHYHALFMVGLILFAITFLVNTIADVVVRGAGGVKT